MSKYYARRENFLKLVKRSDICIGSMGLDESIGWKTAEYVAASRAIVNEELHFEVPGNFMENKNYLSFKNVEECLHCVEVLFSNPDYVYQMKKNNEEYYKSYLKPEMQMLNAINIVLNKGASIQ